MEINEFKSRLKSGNLSGAYVFAGEEDYLKRHYLGELRRAVLTDEAFDAFNHAVFDGEELGIAALLDEVKAPPMMSDYKLVEWHYPDLTSLKESELDDLEMLLATRKAEGFAILVFLVGEGAIDFGTPKKPSTFLKRFGKSLDIIKFDRSSDQQLAQWIRRHLDSEGVSYTPDLPQALIFRSGHSMQQLKNEIDKLTAYAKSRDISLTPSEVALIATPTTECDTFAFSNAILGRDKQAALAALADMKMRRVDPTVILGMAARVICDLVEVANLSEEGMSFEDIAKTLSMNAYKLKLYLAAVRNIGRDKAERMLSELSRTDTASKFGGIGGYTAIELYIMQNM